MQLQPRCFRDRGKKLEKIRIMAKTVCNEIRKMNSNIIVIGKTTVDNDKEDLDNDPDDDDVDNVEESEGDEFEQETG
ncbi:hypothetical protein AG4045_011371 [Apium graveolens]|uniref:Uncharacterized protein n=1 Tax=Apium graveolens TaxID=4045 RepID=A0A6L5B7Z5_APIGR|nr:hypothetical protein AG4045_011371 [Apium graveolens]